MEEKLLLKLKEVERKVEDRLNMNKKEKKTSIKEEWVKEDFHSKKNRVANVILPDIEG
ncbi:hypothetical protein CACET_c05820 [Clostridium aceticum]|uniref:Uncharacterized protein n=1 Tax=Clostridium aceticum TaxID=84022 RepID=A0A0G3W867_9CLOT|nr:hypothetical protein [Clostridium aceticum]AKL94092.1 hypothetical protein CACET_c05820 [Clostridium aceticum]